MQIWMRRHKSFFLRSWLQSLQKVLIEPQKCLNNLSISLWKWQILCWFWIPWISYKGFPAKEFRWLRFFTHNVPLENQIILKLKTFCIFNCSQNKKKHWRSCCYFLQTLKSENAQNGSKQRRKNLLINVNENKYPPPPSPDLPVFNIVSPSSWHNDLHVFVLWVRWWWGRTAGLTDWRGMAHKNERFHAGRRKGKLFFSHSNMLENYVGKFVRFRAGSGSGSSFYDNYMYRYPNLLRGTVAIEVGLGLDPEQIFFFKVE